MERASTKVNILIAVAVRLQGTESEFINLNQE